jgi:hypothetical protein
MGVVSPLPNQQAGGSAIVSCHRERIPNIRNYPQYSETVYFIPNQRTRHAVVMKKLLNVIV